MWTDEGSPGGPVMMLMGACGRCRNIHQWAQDPDLIPVLVVDTETRTCWRHDGTPVVGRENTERLPLCPPCVAFITAAAGRSLPVVEVYTGVRWDAFDHGVIESGKLGQMTRPAEAAPDAGLAAEAEHRRADS